ncbi:MAG: hypothetical protein AAF552_03930, partial [Pseudomonadota bacterium]
SRPPPQLIETSFQHFPIRRAQDLEQRVAVGTRRRGDVIEDRLAFGSGGVGTMSRSAVAAGKTAGIGGG